MTPAEERKLKNANLPLLIASWYPFSDAETLKQITYFVSWMYVIDDAIIDKISWPGLDNATAFDAAYAELMDFVFRSLDLDDVVKNEQPKSSVPAIDSFRLIGQILCEKYSLAQRRKFFEACRLTMEGYRTEQRLRVSGRISSWEEYWTYREGSSCMSMNVAMIELAIGSHLPEEVLDSEEMKLLCKQTVVVSWLVNDIVSAKKELSEGFIENAVPLLAIESGNAQDGMDNTVGFAKQAVARFEELALNAERKFCSLVEDEMAMSEWGRASPETLAAEVSKFIESCKCIMTGALSWRYVYRVSFILFIVRGTKRFFQSRIATIWSPTSAERLSRWGKLHDRPIINDKVTT